MQTYIQKFRGNLAQVIAAQNEGPTGVDRQIEEANEKAAIGTPTRNLACKNTSAKSRTG